MKIALISLYFDPNAIAIRLLSSILKRDFPEDIVNVVLLSHKFKPPRMDFDLETPEDLAAIQNFFADQQYDLIGISLMTNYFERAVQLSQAIRQVSTAKIMWGGIHPTLCPEECVHHADIVFVGEAEQSLPEVVRRLKNRQPITGMPGVWMRISGAPVGQGACPPCLDLDTLPMPDYDFNTHFVFDQDQRKVMRMHAEYLSKDERAYYGGKPFHRIITARGCSQACSYCINSKYQKILGLGKRIRKRSIQSVFNELERVKGLGTFQSIVFIDDDICLRSADWLKEFSILYRDRIGLPFVCQATPGRVTPEKIRYLKEAGASTISMGVQTGSDELNFKVFNRMIGKDLVLRASKIIKEEAPNITRSYDFLIRNPYETLKHKIETARLILQLPPPYIARTYALTLFPGLPLTERAMNDGIINSGSVGSIYDYDGNQQDYLWQKSLEKSSAIPIEVREKLLKIFEQDAPRSIDELICLIDSPKQTLRWKMFNMNELNRLKQEYAKLVIQDSTNLHNKINT